MELEKKEKALEDLRVVAGGGFKGVKEILSGQCEIVKETDGILNVLSTKLDLGKASCRTYARRLIGFLIEKAELFEVRDDREEDGRITYTFKLESTFRTLVVELMLVWKDRR